MATLKQIAVLIVTILAVAYLINQCRKPRGWLGRFFLWEMGGRHSGVTDWGLSHVAIERHYKILDVGCGGGRTISKLAAVTVEGKVYGVDYSPASVAASQHTNQRGISEGRVEIRRASVSALPFPDCSFDLVTAVETHYYWPNLVADLQEILRVLKPEGQLVIIAEAYKRRSVDQNGLAMKLLRAQFLTTTEPRERFEEAGYSPVEIFEAPKKGWICVTGNKPKARVETEVPV